MADMLKRLMTVEVKETEVSRVLEIAGSTEDKDRMGDIIMASGWKLKEFKKNPVFLWAHDYRQPPIGKALKVWIDKETSKLMFKIEFAPPEVYEFADTIYKLYVGGFLHATSVGFIPLDWEGKDEENPSPKWENNVYLKQELLELSAVPVPANANALVEARDQGLITVKEFEHLVETKNPDDPGLSYQIVEVSPDPAAEVAKQMAQKVDAELTGPAAEPDPEPREISQAQLGDDIAYLRANIEKVGLNDDNLVEAWTLTLTLLRLTGNDIPDDILREVKAVIGEKQEAPPVLPDPLPDPVLILKQRAADVAEVANLVLAKLKGKRIPK